MFHEFKTLRSVWQDTIDLIDGRRILVHLAGYQTRGHKQM